MPQAFAYSFSTHQKYNEIPALKAGNCKMKEENIVYLAGSDCSQEPSRFL